MMFRTRAWLLYLTASVALSLWAVLSGTTGSYEAVAVGTLAAVVAARRLHRPTDPAGWTVGALGVGCWAAADVLWSVLDATGGAPFPSLADALYLLGYLLLLASVWRIAAVRVRDRETAVDVGVLLAGAASMIAPELLEAAGAETSWLGRAVAIGYPLLSLALFGGVARVWLSHRAQRPALSLLGAGFGVQLLADAAYASQSVSDSYFGGVVDFAWLLAYSLIGAAALHPAIVERPRPRRTDRWTLSGGRIAMLASGALAPHLGHLLFGMPLAVSLSTNLALAVVCVVRVAFPIEAMRRAATTDELTGLPNRLALLDHIDDAIDSGASVAVLYCDIDRLRLVNDALGIVAGDALIAAVAARIASVVDDGGVVGRLTGDELVVVLPEASESAADRVACAVQGSLAAPISLDDIELRPTLSIGIALGGSRHTATTLLRRADIALARAKALGTGRVAHADGDDDDAYWRMRLAGDLRNGLEAGEITVALQPEIDLTTGALFGFEALARWQHPALGAVGPAVFIPLAEETGLVDALFSAVLDAALAEHCAWTERYDVRVPVSVNVSPLQLGPELVQRVRDALDRWQPRDCALWLEITETTMADDPNAVSVLRDLRTLGVRLAIDDFGTGHSSLTRLAAVEWDAIKIDRSFVDRMLGDEQAHAITSATIAMAKAMGVLTIAEGVETAPQRDELIRLGCDVSQGFLVARPLGTHEADAVVRVHASSPTATNA